MTAVPARALVIGLGGNLGDEADIVERFRAARAGLAFLGPSVVSPVYRTAPHGPPQPDYLNAAMAFSVEDDAITPAALIARVLEVEAAQGRVRDPATPLGPRTLDLDVLVWGTRQLALPGLMLPHPRLHQRRFALAPMIDILGEEIVIPGMTITLMDAWDALRREGQVVARTRWDVGGPPAPLLS